MSSSCELTPQARAFSTVLTAFIGSIVNGISSGALVAFVTAWISWFASLRVLSGSLFALYQAFASSYTNLDQQDPEHDPVELQRQRQPGGGIETTHDEIRAQIMGGNRAWFKRGGAGQMGRSGALNRRLNKDITVLGWIGWCYTAIYSPIVNALWLAENFNAGGGALKLVRVLGISVSALGLTIDTKRRYAARLRDANYGGTPAYVAFNIMNTLGAFSMGIMCLSLLIRGAIDLQVPVFAYVVYCIFMVIWTAGSYAFTPVQDGGLKGYGIILDLLMGAFAGVFLAAPAFGVMQSAEFPSLGSDGFVYPESGSASLKEYLSCDGVATWQKFVAIFP